MVSIICVLFNNEDLIDQFVSSVQDKILNCLDSELILIDNKSTDNSISIAEKYESQRIKLLKNPENLGYAAAINKAAAVATGNILIISNPDILIHEFSPTTLEIVDQGSTGILWVKIMENGVPKAHTQRFPSVIDHVLGYTPVFGLRLRERAKKDLDVSHGFYGWGMGSFCVVSRTAFDSVGGWDESYFLFKEETDFAKMLCDKGRLSRYTEKILITHLGGQSTKNIGDQIRYWREASNVHYFKKHFNSRRVFLLFACLYKAMEILTHRKVYGDIFQLHYKAWRHESEVNGSC